MEPSQWQSSDSNGSISREDAIAYLDRIHLPHTTLDEPPSLTLLSDIQLNHLLHVPFDSSFLHLNTKEGASKTGQLKLGDGGLLALGQDAFDRIVRKRRGAFCLSMNTTLAFLLRKIGFRVSECVGKVYALHGKNPETEGYKWTNSSHCILVVDWKGSDARYQVDVGFGGSQCHYPLEIREAVSERSGLGTTRWRLTKHAVLPGLEHSLPDPVPYYMLSRYEPGDKAYWSPLYAFPILTVTWGDMKLTNFYCCLEPDAAFPNMLLVGLVQKDGGQKTLMYRRDEMGEGENKGKAAFIRTSGDGKKTTEWVEMRIDIVDELLQREFGMGSW